MNIFYAPPDQIQDNVVELTGQEAIHASKALRYQKGDSITVVDGIGGWYEGRIQLISNDTVRIAVQNHIIEKHPRPEVIVGMGIIKKRDRLEFAVEKAVELGVREIALFRGEHSVKQNVRADRLESIAVSAMKQSLQVWLPAIKVYKNMDDILRTYFGYKVMAAHQKGDKGFKQSPKRKDNNTLLLVGPEGGFSQMEMELLTKENAHLISLGENRLRTETAVITFLSQFHYWRFSG